MGDAERVCLESRSQVGAWIKGTQPRDQLWSHAVHVLAGTQSMGNAAAGDS